MSSGNIRPVLYRDGKKNELLHCLLLPANINLWVDLDIWAHADMSWGRCVPIIKLAYTHFTEKVREWTQLHQKGLLATAQQTDLLFRSTGRILSTHKIQYLSQYPPKIESKMVIFCHRLAAHLELCVPTAQTPAWRSLLNDPISAVGFGF